MLSNCLILWIPLFHGDPWIWRQNSLCKSCSPSDNFWVGRFKYKLSNHLAGTFNDKQEFYHQGVLTLVQHDVLFGNETSLQMQMMIGNQKYSYHPQIFTKFWAIFAHILKFSSKLAPKFNWKIVSLCTDQSRKSRKKIVIWKLCDKQKLFHIKNHENGIKGF